MQHIEEVIREIETRIGRLLNLKTSLITEFGVCVPAPLVPDAPVALPTARAERKGKLKTARAAKLIPLKEAPAKRTYKLREGGLLLNPSIISAVRKLPVPFTTEVLVANGICTDRKQADNYLQRCKRQGWVILAGRGQWKRTSTFGFTAVAPANTAASAAQAALDSIHGEITRGAEVQ